MKRLTPKHRNYLTNLSQAGAVVGLLGLALALAGSVQAAALYKINNSDNLNSLTSWSTTSGAQTPNPTGFSASDKWYINETTMLGNKTVSLGADITIGGIALDYVSANNANDLTINSGNTLTLNGTTLYGNGAEGAGGSYSTAGIVQNRGLGGSLTLNCNLALGAAQQWVTSRALTIGGNIANSGFLLTVNTATTTAPAFSGNLSGTGGLTKTGSGTLTLSGPSSYSGATTISAGTLALSGTGFNLGGTVTVGGGALNVSGNGTLANTGDSLVINSGTTTITGSGTLTTSGYVKSSATSSKGTLNINAGGTLTCANLSSSWGTTMALNGTLITSGTFLLSGGTSTITGSGTAKVNTLRHANYGTDNYNGARFNIGSGGITSDGTTPVIQLGATTLGAYNNWSSSAPMALTSASTGTTINTLDSVDGSTARTITLSGILSGAGALKKAGAGTLNVNNAETYSGNTTVTAGTLALGSSGTLDSTPQIILASGATFDVSAPASGFTFKGSSPVQTLAASSTSGTANITATGKAVTLNQGALLSFQADGTGATVGKISVAGSLALNANAVMVNVSGNALAVGEYILMDCSDMLVNTGTFGIPAITGSGLASGNVAVVSVSGNRLILTVSSPSAAISATPTIFPAAVSTTYGTASSPTSVSVSGSSLTADITATAPAGFEISSDGASYGATATFVQAGGSASGTLYLRLKNSAPVSGSYNSASVTLASAGATTVKVSTAASGNSVAPKALNVVSATAQDKMYDGTTAATVTGTLDTAEAFGAGDSGDGKPYSGDAVSASAPGTFASSAVGTGISVTAGTFTLGGAAAGNYTVTQPSGLGVTATILDTAVWTQLAGGSWPAAGNWQYNLVGTGSGNTVDFSTLDLTADTTVTLDGARTIGNLKFGDTSPSHNWTLNSGSGGSLTLAGTAPTITVSNQSATIGADLAGTAGLTKTGNGMLVLNSVKTYTGGTTVNGGTLRLTASSGGTGTIRGALTANSGTTVEIGGTDVLGYGGGATAVSTLNLNGGTITQTQNRNETFSGTMNLAAATVAATGGASALFDLYGGLAAVNTLADANSSVISSPLRLRQNDSTFTVADGSAVVDLLVSGAISRGTEGNGAIVKAGVGTMVLAGNNTYSGNTTINGGVLKVTGGIYRGTYITSTVTVNAGAVLELDNWQYDVSGGSLGGLRNNTPSMVVNGGTIRIVGTTATSYERGVTVNSGGATLEAGSGADWTIAAGTSQTDWAFNSNPALMLTGAGTGTFDKVIASGTGSLTKAGSGTWTLGGQNSYTGPTIVSAGKLLVNGSLAAESAVTVQAGATLGGTGTIGGATVSDGTLAPGANGIGTLTINNALTLNPGSSMLIKLNRANSQTSDKVAGLTSLVAAGTLTVTNIGESIQGGDSFTLFSIAPTGAFAVTNLPALGAGLNWWTPDNYATLVANRAPVDSLTHNLTRAKGATVKIKKADLMAGVSDPDSGDSASYDALVNTGGQGATVTEDATYVYYVPANDNNDTLQFRVKDTRGGFLINNIAITVQSATGLPGGQVAVSGTSATLSFFGIPGYAYKVQRSLDLSSWADLPNSTTNAPAAGGWQYVDEFSDLGYVPAAAYYRLVQP